MTKDDIRDVVNAELGPVLGKLGEVTSSLDELKRTTGEFPAKYLPREVAEQRYADVRDDIKKLYESQSALLIKVSIVVGLVWTFLQSVPFLASLHK